MKIKSVERLALRDISAYMDEINASIHGENHDIWVVTSKHLCNPHVRKLNRELGLNTLNYGKRTQNTFNL
jgi:hypothetical protein